MAGYTDMMKDYWNGRFAAGREIWGDAPSTTAGRALEVFRARKVAGVLVPGAGYGRNSRLFSSAGLAVTGIEVADEAVAIARQYDPRSDIRCGSFLDAPLPAEGFDAVYCFNVLHLFRRREREVFVAKCRDALRPGGVAVFAVFSESEKSFGKGAEVEENTFESKPGRPVHYFGDDDLREHFAAFAVLETGLAEDREDHGDEGPHVHVVRYIVAEKI